MNLPELEAYAWDMGAVVVYGDIPTAFCCLHSEGPIIGMPSGPVKVDKAWLLGHELGHLVLGHRPGDQPCLVQEIQANHWATKAVSGRMKQ